MCCLWFNKMVARFRKLPTSLMILHVKAKVLFAIGVGMLLAGYIPDRNWVVIGWFLIILGCLLIIPSTYLILFKKK